MIPIDPTAVGSARELTLDGLLAYAASQNGSDLFLKAGARPAIKANGRINPTAFPVLDEEDARRLAYEHMREDQKAQFEKDR
jgi:Tfp pilus assembly pilus retraction ATPase PilT